MTTLSAVFKNTNAANQVIAQLLDAGFERKDISVISPNHSLAEVPYRTAEDAVEEASLAESGFKGAAVGGALGALAAGLTAVGAVAIPGVGLLASGPIAAALAGAGAGGAVGGLIGGLMGIGVTESEAKLYESRLHAGEVLVTLNAHSSMQEKEAEAIFDRYDVVSHAA